MGWKEIKMIAYGTYNNNHNMLGLKDENFNSELWKKKLILIV